MILEAQIGEHREWFRPRIAAGDVASSFVLSYAGAMARPNGRTKPARLTVNLDSRTYASLVDLAKREDVSMSWVVRRAIESLLLQDQGSNVGPSLMSPTDTKDKSSQTR